MRLCRIMTVSSGDSTPLTPMVFFDVDGTIIARDSFRILTAHVLRREPFRVFLFLAGLVPFFLVDGRFGYRSVLKSTLLWSLTAFRGRRGAVYLLTETLPQLLLPWVFAEAAGAASRWRDEGCQVCYVSASGEAWLRPLLATVDPGDKIVIGTRLGFRWWGVALVGENCWGEEKLRRIGAKLGSHLEWRAAYSDHVADLPLLRASRQRFVVNPTQGHLTKIKSELNELTPCRWSLRGRECP